MPKITLNPLHVLWELPQENNIATGWDNIGCYAP